MNDRYSRQTILPEIGVDGQQHLLKSQVAIVGCGGLGAVAAAYLAGAGIGSIHLIDADIPELSNLHRQIIYKTGETKSKANALRDHLNLLNPEVQVVVHNVMLNKENIDDILTGVDLVMECTDDMMTKYLVNDFCNLESMPLVYGAIHQFEGQLCVFRNQDENDIHLRDVFPEPDLSIPNCSEAGVIGMIAGIIGLMQANEAIKFLLDIGTTMESKLLTYNALNNQQYILHLKKNWREDLEELYESRDYKGDGCHLVQDIKFDQLKYQRDAFHLISILDQAEHQDVLDNVIHIPLKDFNLANIPGKGREKTVIYCRAGRQSRLLIQQLLEKDASLQLFNLKGGLKEALKSTY